MSIWADESTNALIITAPPKTMKSMMAVIDKLDIRRAQVLVEAIIVEVSSDKAAELGVTWAVGDADLENAAGLTKFDNTTGVTGIAGAILGGGSGSGSGTGSTANAASLIGNGLTMGIGRLGESGLSFVALIEALEADGSSNIIGTPVLVTLDNEEAEIKVGQEVPFVTGSYTNTGATGGNSSVNPFQTIEREQVGLTLKLTPQINEGDAVRLKVEQEISSLLPSAQAVDLITSNRSINTSVIVEDGGTLVLGGLIQDQITETQQRVPILGRIPLVGWLFRSDSTTKKKTNLMVFIKPTILRDNVQAAFETNAKYNYIRDEQLGIKPKNPRLMPRTERSVLPEMSQPSAAPGGPAPASPLSTSPEPPVIDLRTRPVPAAEPAPVSQDGPVSSLLDDLADARRVERAPEVASQLPPEVRRYVLPFAFAKRHGVLINGLLDGRPLTIVRSDAKLAAISEVRRFVDGSMRLQVVPPAEFDRQLQQTYERESNTTMQMVDGLGEDTDLFRVAQELPEPSDLLESDDDAPIIRLINALLTSAVKENASDIHIEPFENRLVVRFRVDGVLREVLQSRRPWPRWWCPASR